MKFESDRLACPAFSHLHSKISYWSDPSPECEGSCYVWSMLIYLNFSLHHKCCWFSLILLKFCSKMSDSAGRMLASKIAYSARNSTGRIYPSLLQYSRLPFSYSVGEINILQTLYMSFFHRFLFPQCPSMWWGRNRWVNLPSPYFLSQFLPPP